MSNTKPFCIPSYEDPAGTDPVTPAVSFVGGVVSKNHIPVMIDFSGFPDWVWLNWRGRAKYYIAVLPNQTNYMGLGIDLVYFKNGYIGWKTAFAFSSFSTEDGPSGWVTTTIGRAYDITQSTGISIFGKYSLLSARYVTINHNGVPLVVDCSGPFTITEDEPTLG